VDWIDVAEKKDKWWGALVTAVMNLGFNKVQEVSCLKNCAYDVAHPLHSP